MDALQAIIAIGGGGGTMIVIGVAIGRSQRAATQLGQLAKKLHEIENWRNATLPKEYVQKEALALQLKPLTESIAEMKVQQGDIAKDLKALTRHMDQRGGAGVA